jgi:Transmembrane protein of unknown function (DUF3556)
MAFLKPAVPPFDPLEWAELPFRERARLACQAYAVQGWGFPSAVYLFYAFKMAFYIFGWLVFMSFTPGMGLGNLDTFGDWWLSQTAFQKAVIWSMLFEGLGLGCGSGPLTARYFPPFTAFLHFFRPGTIKRPLFAGLPVLGGYVRTPLDVALYGAAQVLLVAALVSDTVPDGLLIAIAVVYVVLALCDKTIFLSARGEHYWTTIVVFALASNWIPAAQAVWIALWFWAGVSKLTHHFTSVICVMWSNAPPTAPIPWFRKAFYRRYPDDLRPSRLADIAHLGAALEFAVPTVALIADGGTLTTIGLVMMVFLHVFITSQVPAGVPLEWNAMMIYGGLFLFLEHAEVAIWDMTAASAVFLAVMLVAIPLLGNLVPSRVSFLMAMRYYAGNWPFGVWLFRGESHEKLERIKKTAAWVPDQVERFYDRRTAVGAGSRVMGWRLMHLQGRTLSELIPKTVDRLEDYTWVDGEVVCGMVLGYNFGDGHLHDEEFLAAVQEQCGFDDGELRVIMVEGQPILGGTVNYRVHDAKRGKLAEGEISVRELRERQAWDAPGAEL